MKAIISVLFLTVTLAANAQSYRICPLPTFSASWDFYSTPSTYNWRVNISGTRACNTRYIINGVIVPDMMPQNQIDNGVVIKSPMNINTPTSYKLDRAKINVMPYTNVNEMLSVFPKVHQQKRGACISVGASGKDGMLYVLDGMVVML